PSDHLQAIILFLFDVLVEQQARRFAATSKVDANAGVAVSGQIRMSERVTFVRSVALAIWQILQDRRNRVLLGILRQPKARRQHRTVFQRYQHVLNDPHGSREGRDNHGDTPIGSHTTSDVRLADRAAKHYRSIAMSPSGSPRRSCAIGSLT